MTDKRLTELVEEYGVAYSNTRFSCSPESKAHRIATADAILSEIRQRLDAMAVVPSVPEGCVVVPKVPTSAMLDVAVSHALMVHLGGNYGWTDYMTDVWTRMLAAAPQSPAIAAERVAELERDAGRLDWLADPENMLGSVGLPRECVEPNIHSMREAIDMAMAMDKAIAGAGRG